MAVARVLVGPAANAAAADVLEPPAALQVQMRLPSTPWSGYGVVGTITSDAVETVVGTSLALGGTTSAYVLATGFGAVGDAAGDLVAPASEDGGGSFVCLGQTSKPDGYYDASTNYLSAEVEGWSTAISRRPGCRT